MATQVKCPKCAQLTDAHADAAEQHCAHCGAALPASSAAPLREAVAEGARGVPQIPPVPRPGWDRPGRDDYDDRPRRSRGAATPGMSTAAIVLIVCVVVGAVLILPILGVVFWFFVEQDGAQGPKRAIAIKPMAVAKPPAVAEMPMDEKMENPNDLLAKKAIPFKVIPAGQGQFKKPAVSAKPTDYLRAVSSDGDFIGQGKTYLYPGNQLRVERINLGRGVHITVEGWDLYVGAPQGTSLEVGEYLGAKRYGFINEAPGIDFFGQGRGSSAIAGRFVVWELETNGDQFTRLAIDFVQHSEEVGPPLTGTIRINSTFE